MSTLVFDGTAHTLTLYDAKNQEVDHWHANNVVDHKATMRFVPNGSHQIIDPNRPHRHGGSADTLNGAYGQYGIIRLSPFNANGTVHSGVGIHAGRADKGGADHATMGCIRTTDEAMAAIVKLMASDPLKSVLVRNNHDQHNPVRHRKGDQHTPGTAVPQTSAASGNSVLV